MEDIRPSARPARVDLLGPNDGNKSDNRRPLRPLNLKTVLRKTAEPLLDADTEKEEKHQLDELA
jgi:hypothetical protein